MPQFRLAAAIRLARRPRPVLVGQLLHVVLEHLFWPLTVAAGPLTPVPPVRSAPLAQLLQEPRP